MRNITYFTGPLPNSLLIVQYCAVLYKLRRSSNLHKTAVLEAPAMENSYAQYW